VKEKENSLRVLGVIRRAVIDCFSNGGTLMILIPRLSMHHSNKKANFVQQRAPNFML